jgi:hypothetical protein
MINLTDLLARARQHDPEAALALADLVEQTLLRQRRGGDRQADHRRRRDEALRALARLTGNDRSVERQARDLAQRLARYRPMAGETSPERRLMRKVIDTGLGVPQPDRLARIIRSD